MAIQQASFFCPVCQQQRLFTAQNQVNQVFYLILTLFSCGLWGIVWLIQNLSYTPRFHCSQCGHSDAYKYLANPNLRSQEAQQKAERAALRGETSPSFFNSFTDWFSGLHIVKKALVIYFGLVAVVIVASVVVVIIQSIQKPTSIANSNSNSNKAIASETPFIPPPSTLSSEVNLEKAKKAFNDGDQHTAWNHLYEIKKGAKEFSSAQQLLARIGEREKIEFELAELNEQEANLKRANSGLAYRINPSDLAKESNRLERRLREVQARRIELERKLKNMS